MSANNVKIRFIDFFCGAGGYTEAAERARIYGSKAAKVIACVNHDANAIASHTANHPDCVHFTEDIRKLDPAPLIAICRETQKKYPNSKLCLFAALECTNHSKAKGGLAREQDSRTLANDLFRYLDAFAKAGIVLDYVWIENVEEFMIWGPLNKQGKPIPKYKGRDYKRWVAKMESRYNFTFKHKILNSADFGAYTSRRRFFGFFGKPGLPIVFPKPTHNRNGTGGLKKWNAVKDKLDFNDEGESIFHELFARTEKAAMKYLLTKVKVKKPKKGTKRVAKKKQTPNLRRIVVFPKVFVDPQFGMEPKLVLNRSTPAKFNLAKDKKRFGQQIAEYCKTYNLTVDEISFYLFDPLSPKTKQRVYAGLVKFVANGDTSFVQKYYSGRPKGKVNSTNEPCPVITTGAGLTLVQAQSAFMVQHNTGEPGSKIASIEQPSRVITATGGNLGLVQTKFLSKGFSGDPDSKNISVDGPAGSITTKDHHFLVQPCFLLKYNSTNKKTGKYVPPSVEDPAPVIDTQGRLGLVQAHFLLGYYSNGGKIEGGSQQESVENPCPTLSTKDRFNLVSSNFLVVNHGKSMAASVDSPSPPLMTRDKIALVHTHWIDRPFTDGGSKTMSIDSPAGTILTTPKMNLVDAWILAPHYDNKGTSIDEPLNTITANRKHHCLMFPQWGVNCGHSVEKPSPVIPAKSDKMSPQLITADENEFIGIILFDSDSEIDEKIKIFMACYGIIDIKMRMLRIPELKRIQGVGDDYVLIGTQAEQKKYLGNMVVVEQGLAIIETYAEALTNPPLEKAA